MNKQDVVNYILRNSNYGDFVNTEGGFAWAPSNVALCKYWGKRDTELNLPQTSSLSISLGNKGAATKITHVPDADEVILNEKPVSLESKFVKRLQNYLNLFRPKDVYYRVEINSTVPIAAGMASSACGFASIIQALNNLYAWRLPKKDLSILARLGSGSACRSLWEGFVEWQCGTDPDGMDSFAKPLPFFWSELRIGALIVSTKEKPMPSTEAMQHTVATSPLYENWPRQVAMDLDFIKHAIAAKDFSLFGSVSEGNALAMHLLMLNATPSVSYALPETLDIMQQISELRRAGTEVYFTQDAGPNLQLMFLAKDTAAVQSAFPNLEIITPFVTPKTEQLIIVDDQDNETATDEKMSVHVQGKLHRAFSVIIYRYNEFGHVEILLQQRSSTKYHSANLWANTCCSHPRPGEDITEAGARRLYEELGFAAELQDIGCFHYEVQFSEVDLIENEIDHVLIADVSYPEINPDVDEVQATQWILLEQLETDLAQNSHKYVIWLKPVLAIFTQWLAAHNLDEK